MIRKVPPFLLELVFSLLSFLAFLSLVTGLTDGKSSFTDSSIHVIAMVIPLIGMLMLGDKERG